MGKNDMIKMKLTPQEVLIIENIRAMQGQTVVVNSEVEAGNKLMEKYMDMDDNEFIDEYAEMVGDDVILSVLQDTLDPQRKMESVIAHIDEDVIDELFEAYVSQDSKRELFLETQDREELCVQMVDLIMDGDWTPEN